MANPGYPMQPMGGPPMGGGPMGPGGPPMGMRPSGPMPMPGQRRGTPKAVPVIVSAGLAVGVFCGLLFGLGTGEEAKAENKPKDKEFVGTKIEGTDEVATSTGTTGPTPPKSVTDGKLVTGTMKEPKGSAAGSAGSGSAAGSATVTPPPVPQMKMAKLQITVKPDSAKDPKITVDGTEVTGGAIDLPLGEATKKDVVIVIKASGFKDLEQKLEVDEGEMKVEYSLIKKSSGGVSAPKRPDPPGGRGTPGSKKPPKKTGGGGLIDI